MIIALHTANYTRNKMGQFAFFPASTALFDSGLDISACCSPRFTAADSRSLSPAASAVCSHDPDLVHTEAENISLPGRSDLRIPNEFD